MDKLPRKAPSKKVLLTAETERENSIFFGCFCFFLCYDYCLGPSRGGGGGASLNSRNANVLLTGFAVGSLVFRGRHHTVADGAGEKENITLPGKINKNTSL